MGISSPGKLRRSFPSYNIQGKVLLSESSPKRSPLKIILAASSMQIKKPPHKLLLFLHNFHILLYIHPSPNFLHRLLSFVAGIPDKVWWIRRPIFSTISFAFLSLGRERVPEENRKRNPCLREAALLVEAHVVVDSCLVEGPGGDLAGVWEREVCGFWFCGEGHDVLCWL
jgi:hypothetical protein